MDQDVHQLLIEKLYDEKLEASGFVFHCNTNVIIEIYNVNDNDIQASWVELL